MMGRDDNPELRKNWIEATETAHFAYEINNGWGDWYASVHCHNAQMKTN